MEASTSKDFFERILPKKFNPSKAENVDVIVQVSLTGNDGEEWVVKIKDQKMEIEQGVHPSPNLSLRMLEKDFLELVNGKISAEKAFFLGKVKFKGNIALALKLRDAGFL